MRKVILLIIFMLLQQGITIASPNPFKSEQIMVPVGFIENPVNKQVFTERLQALVSKSSNNKAVFVDYFKGPSGLIGVIFKGPNQDSKQMIGWKPPGADILIIGPAVDMNGDNLTMIATQNFINQTNRAGAQDQDHSLVLNQVINDAAAFVLFDAGQGARVLSMVVDPACSVCKNAVAKIKQDPSFFHKNKMTVRVIPIAREDSGYERRAAALLQYGADATKRTYESVDPANVEAVRINTKNISSAIPELQTPMFFMDGKPADLKKLLSEGENNDSK